jgi:hypothetical protein
MCRQNHGVAVDYFAVGVIAFECMFGRVIFFLIIRGLTLENLAKKSETTSFQSKFRSKEMKFPEVGASRRLISSTK